MKTRAVLGFTLASLLAACSSGPPASTAAAPPAAPIVAVAPGTAVPVAAIPIGSPKFGVTSDCNAMSGGTVQGRTSAISMLDCAPIPEVRPVAAVAPAPRPAAAPQTYTVYFDFNRADVSPEARSVIEQAAASARSGGATRIQVVGHTDTAGTPRYNDRLSASRAEAVRKALVAAGVPAGEIAARGVGENDLAVQTPNGVREPRNRRVTIEAQRAGM